MPSSWIIISIAIVMTSFAAGFGFFYLVSPLTKEVKKHQLEELLSLLINYFIYIWVGKVILNIGAFFSDPLAILAYPSNANAFYVATLLTAVNVIYIEKKGKIAFVQLITVFVPVFLTASFVYEFFQMMLNGHSFGWGYMGVAMVLLMAFMYFHDRIGAEKISFYLMIAWSLGQLLLSVMMPYASVFGYLLEPWFIAIILVVFMLLFFYYNRKRVSL
ncbi:MAG TPA: hypothetical protein VK119_09610 [Bacillota bacterium]|nr:hypothetical protein [Bacillota bacterium]